ncbi:hypothetical protein C426_1207 [Lactococcus garvieae DCC43]|uniref:Uncharacterized protein n=1 Tax=Lactococcus garvieae DCC43 TaxID=1231377 RepID=K2NV49_9LACT|nr:hypothetical protein C426_1207 [Lactococcus garvieae DCC43]
MSTFKAFHASSQMKTSFYNNEGIKKELGYFQILFSLKVIPYFENNTPHGH